MKKEGGAKRTGGERKEVAARGQGKQLDRMDEAGKEGRNGGRTNMGRG